MAETTKHDKFDQRSILGLDENDDVKNIRMEGENLKTAGWVWDTDSMDWVRSQQGLTDSTATELLGDTYYNDYTLAYNASNNLEYVGYHQTMGASVSGTGWLIQKFIYTGSNVTRIQKTTGAWTDRESLFS